MANKWVAEYHEADPEYPVEREKYWEVWNTVFDYYIVEDVGDPKDGERLAAMLNEREELLNKVAEYEKVFRHALNQAPSEAAIAGYTWAWKFDVLVQKIRQVFKG